MILRCLLCLASCDWGTASGGSKYFERCFAGLLDKDLLGHCSSLAIGLLLWRCTLRQTIKILRNPMLCGPSLQRVKHLSNEIRRQQELFLCNMRFFMIENHCSTWQFVSLVFISLVFSLENLLRSPNNKPLKSGKCTCCS